MLGFFLTCQVLFLTWQVFLATQKLFISETFDIKSIISKAKQVSITKKFARAFTINTRSTFFGCHGAVDFFVMMMK